MLSGSMLWRSVVKAVAELDIKLAGKVTVETAVGEAVVVDDAAVGNV